MNNMNFSCMRIESIAERKEYQELRCSTKVLVSNGNFIDVTASVYVKTEVFRIKNESILSQNMLSVNKNVSVTGRTIFKMKNGIPHFDVLVSNQRQIDYARKDFSVIVKLFDISVRDVISHAEGDRMEFLGFYEQENKILVSVPMNQADILEANAEYNLSGSFYLKEGNPLIPVISTGTFVRDVLLSSDDIYIVGV